MKTIKRRNMKKNLQKLKLICKKNKWEKLKSNSLVEGEGKKQVERSEISLFEDLNDNQKKLLK